MSDNSETLLQEQLDDLQDQQTVLADALTTINLEVGEWRSKRDDLNRRSNKLRREIQHFQTIRNQFNDQIKQLQTLRKKRQTQRHERRQEFSAQYQAIKDLQRETTLPKGQVHQELERLEWEIQTNTYSSQKEHQIISQIKLLEEEAQIHQAISNRVENNKQLQQTIRALNSEIRTINEQIKALAMHSQQNHESMIKTIDQLKENQAAADRAHQRFLEQITRLREYRSKYQAIDQRIQELIQTINQNRQHEVNTRLEAVLASKSKNAMKKMKAKKKISFDEFKILMDEDYS